MHRGETVSMVGEYFFASCNDTPGACQISGMSDPMTGVELGFARATVTGKRHVWEKDGRSVPFTTVDADEEGTFIVAGSAPIARGRYLVTAREEDASLLLIPSYLWVR